jgi:hypothetical protein
MSSVKHRAGPCKSWVKVRNREFTSLPADRGGDVLNVRGAVFIGPRLPMCRTKVKHPAVPRFDPNGTTAAAWKDESMHLATGIDHGQPHVLAFRNISLLGNRVPHAQDSRHPFGGLP